VPEAQREQLSADDLFAERLMLGLRFTSGLDIERLARDSGQASRTPRLDMLAAQGLGEHTADGRFRLTRRGLMLHSEVCARLL
jgi:coproporphyrinogen III oxidase-like Fe-S oxidoreductase